MANNQTPFPWRWDGDDLWHFGVSYDDPTDPHLFTGITIDKRLRESPILAENMRIVAATELLVQAARACRAWHVAEEKYLGTFNQRCELSSYSEWLTRKALAVVAGEPFTEQYEGVPYLIVADENGINPHIERASEGDASQLVA